MAKTQKFYVVWKGREVGIFDSWESCKKQVEGFIGAKYKSFKTRDLAEQAFESESSNFIGKRNEEIVLEKSQIKKVGKPILESICVDAACSGNPGVMEYRGVDTQSKVQLFHRKYPEGTNNIGEFLAIVHALALYKNKGLKLPIIYSDSKIALSWLKKKKCKTKLVANTRNQELFEDIARAEQWLENNEYATKILKWQTEYWGEIPADFGRK